MSDTTAVLVVDDNPAMAQTTADILAIKGYTVYMAYSGFEALETLAQHEVHILLTDVVMPDMNGVTLYRQTREPYPHLITFLMTAYAADDLIQQGIAEGVKTVLSKPVDIGLLLNLVEAAEQAYLSK